MLITSNYLIKAFRKVEPLWYPGIWILCTYMCLAGEISSTAVLYLENFPAKEKPTKQEQSGAQRESSKWNKCLQFLAVLGDYSTTAFQKTACNIWHVLLKVILLVTIRKWGTNKEKLISKLLKPGSLVLGSYPWFSHRLQAAGVHYLITLHTLVLLP